MNILFVSQDYIPNLSGVPIVVKYLAEGLAEKGHQITVVTSCYRNCTGYEVINNVSIFRFDLKKTHFDTYKGKIKEYVNFIINFNCDVIVFECATCVTTDVLLPYLDKIKGKKILHSHGLSGLLLKPFNLKHSVVSTVANTYHWLWCQYYFSNILPKYLKKFDLTICLSEVDNTLQYCRSHNCPVQILENAADDIFFKERDRLHFKEIVLLGLPYFLSVANYTHIKNQKGILEEYYKSNRDDYAMVFIGLEKTDYYNELLKYNNQLEKKYGHRAILFLTNIERKYIPNIVENSTLYLVGSTWEMYSISIIEAMTKGVPFISTNVGNAFILPGGITVDKLTDMNHAINSLVNNSKLYKNLSTQGKKYALDNCKRSKIVDKFENLIESII